MLISSFTLSLFGCIYVFCTTMNHNWHCEYLYGEDLLARDVNIFFVASNVMDLILGFAEYPQFMDPLSTTAHHIVYIILEVTVLLPYHWTGGMAHCFFMEVPTLMLSIGSCWPEYRSDLIFGILFCITRLGWNVFLDYIVWLERPLDFMVFAISAVLSLHIYWFSKWLASFRRKLRNAENIVPEPDNFEQDLNGKPNK